MELTLPAFKKAAKRYATAAGKDLSTAQDDLSGFFGFKDFHAAQSLLSRPSGSQFDGTPVSHTGYVWATYDAQQFARLIERLKEQYLARTSEHWTLRARDLLDAVLVSVIADGKTALSTSLLYEAFSLEAIERRYLELCRAHNGRSSSWPRVHRALGRYLEMGLPGFEMRRLGEQTDECCAQHSYLLGYIMPILDRLETIEHSGSEATQQSRLSTMLEPSVAGG